MICNNSGVSQLKGEVRRLITLVIFVSTVLFYHVLILRTCWLILVPMSWTLARHCKVTVDKTSRCRGRVFLVLNPTLLLSCMSYAVLIYFSPHRVSTAL